MFIFSRGCPGGASGKELACQRRRHKRHELEKKKRETWVGSGRFPVGEHGNLLQYSCLENPMDREVWWATVHRVTESDTNEATWHACTFMFSSKVILEKAMAPHSSTPAWKIPWTEEPGRLWSMGLLRVRHDWVTSLSLFTFVHWRRKWQPTPVFLPGESQGLGSLMGCRLWGCTELYTTEVI